MRRENTEEYQEFVKSLKEEVGRITKDWNAEIKFQPAPDEESEDYLAVETNGENGKHVQRFHLWEMYQDFESGELSMEEIFAEVVEMLDCCKEVGRISHLGEIEDYDKICKYLILRPLNCKRNAETIKDGIYDRIGNIALVLYVNIGTVKGLYASSMISTRTFSLWKRDKEEVMETARKNTYELFPPRLFDLFNLESFGGEIGCEFMNRETLPAGVRGSGGLFLTNTNQINGAVSVFLPGVARKLGKLLGSDFYIAFTSLHEAVLHKIGTVEAEQIQECLKSMNAEVIADKDFLSEQVYRYSRENNKIEVVKF